MIKFTNILIGMTMAVVISLGIQSSRSYALDSFDEVCKQADQANLPTVCKDKGNTTNPVSGNDGVIVKAVSLIRVIGGAGAVIMIIFSALTLITSNGDSSKLKKARDNILFASIGLIIMMIAPELIKFIVNWTTP